VKGPTRQSTTSIEEFIFLRLLNLKQVPDGFWIPAFAGMTAIDWLIFTTMTIYGGLFRPVVAEKTK
jgi:hypothetical protein